MLWDDLTVKEHLLFYARIKGISAHKEDEYVSAAIHDVMLESFVHFEAR